MSNKKTVVQLDSSEVATILAALRHWQQDRDRLERIGTDARCSSSMEYAQWEIAAEHGTPLANVQVDGLCERINFSPELTLPIAVVIGGVLQGVFHPVLDAKTEEESSVELGYDLMDFDVLEGNSDEDVATYWNNRAPSTQAYYKKFHPEDAKKLLDAVRRHKRAQRKETTKRKR